MITSPLTPTLFMFDGTADYAADNSASYSTATTPNHATDNSASKRTKKRICGRLVPAHHHF